MKTSVRNLTILATLMFALACAMYANPVNCAATPSNPACAPTLAMTYKVGNGPVQNLAAGGTAAFSSGSWLQTFTPQNFVNGNSSFLFTGGSLASSPDPFIGFSFGVINNTSSVMTWAFDFQTLYAGGPFFRIESVYGDALIDTKFSGTSTVTPVGSSHIMNAYVNGSPVAAINLGMGCTTVAYVCTSPDIGALGPIVYISAATGVLEVKGSFTVTPGGQYTLTGHVDQPVPEPGTLALLGSGIIGLAGLARRRKSK